MYPDPQHIVEMIARHAREVVPQIGERAIGPHDSLRELGANSIDRSEILMMTLQALQLSIPLVKLARAQNIGELAALIAGRGAEVA